MRSVSSSVLAPGCFWMPMITAGRALCEPSPRLIAAPSRTVARSRTRTGVCALARTTTAPMSATFVKRPSPRIRYSWPSAT